MAKTFYITSEAIPQVQKDLVMKGMAVTYQFNFKQWAEENSNVSSVTWSVESGQAAISGQALASNVASALVTFSESGGNLIKLAATASGGQKYVVLLEVVARDPSLSASDYGICG